MVFAALLLATASVTASILMVPVAVLPLVFKYSKSVQRKMVFSNCINYPRNLDYENPSSCNVVGGRHFTVNFKSVTDDCDVKLGVWHIVPCSMFREVFVIRDTLAIDARLHEELKKTRNPVVLYCHGNSNHRGSPHRLQMYKVFQELNFHVITFDYRGYGDSTNMRPTEKGVVEDALAVYAWLNDALSETERPPVIIWGHSLGTAVAANMTAHLSELCCEQGRPELPCPDALVLEAPFNNLLDEITTHPLTKLVSWLPYYNNSFVKPFSESSEFAFKTDQYLCRIPQIPILMLHSKGDKIVPYTLACKLYEKVKNCRSTTGAPLVFHSFERGQGLGHNNLCEAPDLKHVVRGFLTKIRSKTSS
ncbi:hypothetical protein PYW08_010442 [Mythimna loreyi]|uniref:Uncharacterized protein n=1 Tax=Mythimna loreyi TaxID=667449 RepID=A0ACC2Q4S7_9NEOP|nr:hypothetical protein PYW08_010442 [Mythimna loreyi]